MALALPAPHDLGELGEMRNVAPARPRLAILLLLVALPAGLTPSTAADGVAIEPLVATARRAGLRVLESERLVLATDRPARDGDGVADLPAVFDQAFAAWCRHYGVDLATLPEWRAFGCLVVDRERFREAGLLPDDIPEFVNGFCDRNRFWLVDQSNPAYRRHLLLHEGVHAFTLTARRLATPVWYNEGIAEFLATHRVEPTAEGLRFVPTPVPDRPEDVEQLGRIETLHALHQAGTAPGLDAVLATPVGRHGEIADYAASWAAVAMFTLHPRYAEGFATLERGPLGPDFTDRLATLPGYDPAQAARDFDAFIAGVDYGYDFTRSAIDWSPGTPLTAARQLEAQAGRSWQNTGAALVAGRNYSLRAAGRCRLGVVGDVTTETEPAGISLDWYRGRPLGRLMAAQWVESPAGGGRPRFVVLGEGREATFTAATDGPLYLKINEPPADLADDEGHFTVDLAPQRPVSQ